MGCSGTLTYFGSYYELWPYILWVFFSPFHTWLSMTAGLGIVVGDETSQCRCQTMSEHPPRKSQDGWSLSIFKCCSHFGSSTPRDIFFYSEQSDVQQLIPVLSHWMLWKVELNNLENNLEINRKDIKQNCIFLKTLIFTCHWNEKENCSNIKIYTFLKWEILL